MAKQGLRVLALAEIPNTGALKDVTADNKIQKLSDITKYDSFE